MFGTAVTAPPVRSTSTRGRTSSPGAALARLDGQIALDEILKRFPEWAIEVDGASLSSASVVRGWETLPAFIS